MKMLKALIGFIIGFAASFGFHFAVLSLLFSAFAGNNVSPQPAVAATHSTAAKNAAHKAAVPAVTKQAAEKVQNHQPVIMLTSLVAGSVGGVYLLVLLLNDGYKPRILSTLGLVLDLTWSLINSFAGLAVWIPASLMAGGKVSTDDNTKRSCVLNTTVNPRGKDWNTTLGTVVAGTWSAHEETHVWEARMFGPFYMVSYAVALCLNPLFRLVIGKPTEAFKQGYARIPWEDWAYLACGNHGADVSWGWWFLGLLLSSTFLGLLATTALGLFVWKQPLAWIVGIVGIVAYGIVRAILPAPPESV